MSASQRGQTDYLRYYLKRLTAEQALAHALGAQILERVVLPRPLLRVDEETAQAELLEALTTLDEGTLAAARVSEPIDDEQIKAIHRALTADGLLAIVLPVAADTPWQQRLVEHQFEVVQWQPFLSAEAARVSDIAAARQEASLTYTLTGHRVLPWRNVIEPLVTQLRPYFEEDVPLDGRYVVALAKKTVGDVATELPALAPFVLPEETAIPVIAAAPAPDDDTRTAPLPPVASASSPISSFLKNGAAPLLAGIALVAAWLTQGALTDDPAGGIWLFVTALLAMWGVRQVAKERPMVAAFDRQLLVRAGGVLVTLILSLLAINVNDRPLVALPLWLLSVLVGAVLLLGKARLPRLVRLGTTGWVALNAVIVGLLFRYWALTAHPFILNGIEAQLGLEAGRVPTVFGTTWLTNPILPLYLQKGVMAVLGRTTLAARFLSPLIGTLTIIAIYQVGKHLWNKHTGMLAAILLAGSHVHLHYSRLGMTNIYDPLLALVAMGGVAVAWRKRHRVAWLVAGAGIGLSAYVYTAAHLVPLMLVALALFAILFQPSQLAQQWKHVTAATLLALIIALPQITFYNNNQDTFMERANSLGILRNGWLENATSNPEITTGDALTTQFWEAALGFNGSADRDLVYNAKRPLGNVVIGTLFVLGIGLAVFHFREMRYAVLLIMFGVTVVFGGMLLIEPPHSRRLLIALPAVLLLAARAAVWLVENGTRHSTYAARLVLPLLVGIGVLSVVLDVGFYFGSYATDGLYSDRNTEVAQLLGTQLADLPEETLIYFHASPIMYSDFSNIPYLAPQFERGRNIIDVDDANTLPPPQRQADTIIHVFLPEKRGNLEIIRSQSAGGVAVDVNGRYGSPLYTTYTLTR